MKKHDYFVLAGFVGIVCAFTAEAYLKDAKSQGLPLGWEAVPPILVITFLVSAFGVILYLVVRWWQDQKDYLHDVDACHPEHAQRDAQSERKVQQYVLGFMFGLDRRQVALIRKQKPAWQAGKLNGIGGKIEERDLSSLHAMTREFAEETGLKTNFSQWVFVGAMALDPNAFSEPWCVEIYTCAGDLSKLRSMESEQVEVVDVSTIHPLQEEVLSNVPWLVAASLERLNQEGLYIINALYR